MITEEKSDLQKYYLLKKDLDLPVKVKLYFGIFQNCMGQNKAPRTLESKKGFSKALVDAFSNLSTSEKGMYLVQNITFILEHLDRQEKQKTKSDSKTESDQIRNIQTTCEMLTSTLKISHWTTVSLKLDKNKKSVVVTNKKKNFGIDMKNYFVRRSNKYKSSIVLEAITQEINNQGKKYTFLFSNQIVNRIYQEMLKCVFLCQQQKILSLMVEDAEQNEDSNNQANEKTLVFLSSKNINDYLSFKEKVEKQIMQNKYEFKVVLCQSNLRIEQSSKVEKVFKLENCFEVDAKELKEKFLYALAYKNKFITHSQVIEDFSKKYKAVYEKIKVVGRLYEHICIREESISGQEEILFIKGIENVLGGNCIEFLQVRVRTINQGQSKLIIYTSIGLNQSITREVIKQFLLEFNNMIFRKEVELRHTSSMNENDNTNGITNTEENQNTQEVNDDFMTVKGSEQEVGFMEDDDDFDIDDADKTTRLKGKNDSTVESDIGKKEIDYLFQRYQMKPLDQQKYLKLMSKHYLFGEWVRIKEGGVVCSNQQIIGLQKKMFKEALTKMGRNILKGEILKMSLPVILFKKQSHLESIARDFCYAPTLFDKLIGSSDPLERVKAATLLAVSVGTLGISMQKPFNPILGETLQLRIGGCPMYLEQISHHPPIGAYFFQGRDYRIHGQIEPKVSFGLNNLKGYSNRPNFVEFEDGTQIQMIYGKMVIKGMLFGDREFNFEEKIYAYDKTNHIFSEIIYGPRSKRPAGNKKNDPMDFFHGKIYKLKPQFLQKFNSSMPRIYPSKQFIISELSSFQGIWNDEVSFDNKVYINFCKDYPHDLVLEEYPLLSNSYYRTDLLKLLENNLELAQKEKDKLEQVQRRDRKLRQKYKK